MGEFYRVGVKLYVGVVGILRILAGFGEESENLHFFSCMFKRFGLSFFNEIRLAGCAHRVENRTGSLICNLHVYSLVHNVSISVYAAC